MKKMMMIAVMAIATMTASAQAQETGKFAIMPKVGMNCSDITGAKDIVKNKFGLAAGAELEYKVKDWFGVSAGAMYEQQGFHLKDVDKDVTSEYINVPVSAKFYVWKGLSIGAGVQTGFLTKAKFDDRDIKEQFNKVDFGLTSTIAYEFPFGLNLELRYYEGLTDVVKDTEYEFRAESWWNKSMNKNRTLQLTVGYKFQL
jgi:hypothetical protein